MKGKSFLPSESVFMLFNVHFLVKLVRNETDENSHWTK